MNKNKSILLIACLILLCVTIAMCVDSSNDIVVKADILSQSNNSCVANLFGKSIQSIKYMYSCDESADFILVSFSNGGYAVLAKATNVLLEYSEDDLSFNVTDTDKIYYCGPSSFYTRIKNTFQNLYTNESISLSV